MIWVTGASGLLGKEILSDSKSSGLNIIGTSSEVDISSRDSIENFWKSENNFKEKKLDWIINCAAYTNVDKAEEDSNTCRKINTQSLSILSNFAKNKKARILHISTDYVFGGLTNNENSQSQNAYSESDQPDPICEYGKSKYAGEQVLLNLNPNSIILRTSWLYGNGGKNFVNEIIKRLNNNLIIKVVTDQIGSPTWTKDISDVIFKIIFKKNFPSGIWHFSGDGFVSRFNLALEIKKIIEELEIFNCTGKIIPISTEEYCSQTKRPKWSVLSNIKISNELQLNPPNWQQSLRKYLETLKKNYE